MKHLWAIYSWRTLFRLNVVMIHYWSSHIIYIWQALRWLQHQLMFHTDQTRTDQSLFLKAACSSAQYVTLAMKRTPPSCDSQVHSGGSVSVLYSISKRTVRQWKEKRFTLDWVKSYIGTLDSTVKLTLLFRSKSWGRKSQLDSLTRTSQGWEMPLSNVNVTMSVLFISELF